MKKTDNENENVRTKDLEKVSSDVLARAALELLLEKKAFDVRLYHVAETSSVTDYYLNVTGRSLTQVASLADEVAYALAQRGAEPLHTEGKRGTSWILVDYGVLIINVFDRPSREFYHLDRLFPPESVVDISDAVAAVDRKYSVTNSDIAGKEK